MENINITIDELMELDSNEYTLVDIRDSHGFSYGAMPHAIHIEECEVFNKADTLPQDKKMILYCSRGEVSVDIALALWEQGIEAYSLVDGYGSWLRHQMTVTGTSVSVEEEPFIQQVEKSLRKKFHRNIFSKFAKAINEYQLLKEGDKVAVCISGGKDSMIMAKLFQELQRHRKFNFELVFLVMDPGYNELNREVIEDNAKKLHIPITIFETPIFDTVFEIEKSPCYLCARMRRGYLYGKAQELGCNKIALGHHYDDVIETILMGMMYGAQIQSMMPKLHSTNFEGMELIRPMYLIREEDIIKWRDYHGLYFIQCACRFTETCSTCNPDGANVSKRMEIKNLIKNLKETNPFIESNIFRSMENVHIDTVIAYKQKGEKKHFLEEY